MPSVVLCQSPGEGLTCGIGVRPWVLRGGYGWRSVTLGSGAEGGMDGPSDALKPPLRVGASRRTFRASTELPPAHFGRTWRVEGFDPWRVCLETLHADHWPPLGTMRHGGGCGGFCGVRPCWSGACVRMSVSYSCKTLHTLHTMSNHAGTSPPNARGGLWKNPPQPSTTLNGSRSESDQSASLASRTRPTRYRPERVSRIVCPIAVRVRPKAVSDLGRAPTE